MSNGIKSQYFSCSIRNVDHNLDIKFHTRKKPFVPQNNCQTRTFLYDTVTITST